MWPWVFETAVVVSMLLVASKVLEVITRKRYKPHLTGGVLLTGASSGIGYESAIYLARAGFTVFATVRKPADLKALESLKIPTLRPVIMDVALPETIDACISTISDILKEDKIQLVGIINNAGVLQEGILEFHSISEQKKIFDVNFWGPLTVIQRFLPLLRESQGRIINIGSITGKVSFPRCGAYVSSKHAVEGMTDVLRVEVAHMGISVSLVEPGFVKTQLFRYGDIASDKAPAAHGSESEVSAEIKQMYAPWYTARYEKKNSLIKYLGSPPSVVHQALMHALTSSRPKTRYPVAKLAGFPAALVLPFRACIPDTLWDLFVQ